MRVALYTRSTISEDVVMEREKILLNYCKDHNYEIIGVFHDYCKIHEEMNGFAKLKDLCKSGNVDAIVLYDVGSIARTTSGYKKAMESLNNIPYISMLNGETITEEGKKLDKIAIEELEAMEMDTRERINRIIRERNL